MPAATKYPDEAASRPAICEIGRRLYQRGLCCGNDGNTSVRIGDDRVLATPTMICKGFMQPDDLCVIDLAGNQISGARRRTSEIFLHLEIYAGDANARAVVHSHPPHATAFAIARVDIPSGVVPEAELFLGAVPRAAYETPGNKNFAATVRPFVGKSNAVVLSSHGTVSWAAELEHAYWYTEMLDNYCRMLMLARSLGHVERLPQDKVRELLALRPNFGMPPDEREAAASERLFINREWGTKEQGNKETR
ncbi:MAG: class II aldolase/adducin family protein [Phycisphaerae bacterium]